jgi:hypothetical protein
MTVLGRRWGLAVGLTVLLGCVRPAFAQAPVVDEKLQKQINQAIDKGVKYLKSVQRADGTWPRGGDTPGSTALAGWALLESGVKADDPVITKAADYLRQQAVIEDKIYHISLMIFFFDKLGDPADVPLIESLGLRLLQAQCMDGGWTYRVPPLAMMPLLAADGAEGRRLRAIVAGPHGRGERPKLPRPPAQLSREIQLQCARLQPNMLGQADNSNTQFAMIALWVANRYGLPGQAALCGTAQRWGALQHFSQSQQRDGSWGYINAPGMAGNSPGCNNHAMACAGLLGLFVGYTSDPRYANDKELKAKLQKFPPVQRGFKFLANVMRTQQQADPNFFYFLWSMERVGMAYDVKFMDGVDWYKWSAEWLVANQVGDGCWQGGKYAEGECDTSFALLVLKRANVLKPAFGDRDLPTGITETKKTRPKTKPAEDLPLDLPTIVPKDKKDSGAGKDKKTSGGRSSALPGHRDGVLAGLPLRSATIFLTGRKIKN